MARMLGAACGYGWCSCRRCGQRMFRKARRGQRQAEKRQWLRDAGR